MIAKEKHLDPNGQEIDFFHKVHSGKKQSVSYIGFVRRGKTAGEDSFKSVYVIYSINGQRKTFRSPRKKCGFLDDMDDVKIQHILDEWKDRINLEVGDGDLIPPFYSLHRQKFLRSIMKNGIDIGTANDYDTALIKHVFPFLYGKLKLDPKEWNVKVLDKWALFQDTKTDKNSSKNRRKTAIRVYLKYLRKIGYISEIPVIHGEKEYRENIETVIPGSLPDWDEVVAYLEKLPEGRFRYLNVICAAFGIRLGEALGVSEDEIIGGESISLIESIDDHIKRLHHEKKARLFLIVDKAIRSKKSKDEIIKLLSADKDDIVKKPKSGKYTAICTHLGMAKLVAKVLNNNEHKEDLSNPHELFKTVPFDPSPVNFHLYTFHDWRRLHITLVALELVNIGVVCKLHGHSNESTFKKYFQFGLTQRKKQTKKKEIIIM